MADGGRVTPPPVDRANVGPPNISRQREDQKERERLRIQAETYGNRSRQGAPISPKVGDIVEVRGMARVYGGEIKYGVVKFVVNDMSDSNTPYRELMLHVFIPYKNGKVVNYTEEWDIDPSDDLVDMVCTPVSNCNFKMRFKEYLDRFPFKNFSENEEKRFVNPDGSDIWIVLDVLLPFDLDDIVAISEVVAFRGVNYAIDGHIERIYNLFDEIFPEFDLEDSDVLTIEDEESFKGEDDSTTLWPESVSSNSMLFYEPYLHVTGKFDSIQRVHEMVDRSSETPLVIFAGAHSVGNISVYDPYMVQSQPDLDGFDNPIGKLVAMIPPYYPIEYYNEVRAGEDAAARSVSTMMWRGTNTVASAISSLVTNQNFTERCLTILDAFLTDHGEDYYIVAPIRDDIDETNQNDHTFIVPFDAVKFYSPVQSNFLEFMEGNSTVNPAIQWLTNNEFRTLELQYLDGDDRFVISGQIFEEKSSGKLFKLLRYNENVQPPTVTIIPEDKNNQNYRFLEGRDNIRKTVGQRYFERDYRVVKDYDLILWQRTFDRVRATDSTTVRLHIENQLGTGFNLGAGGVENLYIPAHIKVKDAEGTVRIHPHMYSAVDLQRYMLQHIEMFGDNRLAKNNYSLNYVCPYDRSQIVAVGILNRAEIRKRNYNFMQKSRIVFNTYTPPYTDLVGGSSLKMRASNDSRFTYHNNNNNNNNKKRQRMSRPTQEVAVSRDFVLERLQLRIKNLEDLIRKVKEGEEDKFGVKYSEGASLKDFTDSEGKIQDGLETKLNKLKRELLDHLRKKSLEKAKGDGSGGGSESTSKRSKLQFKNLKL